MLQNNIFRYIIIAIIYILPKLLKDTPLSVSACRKNKTSNRHFSLLNVNFAGACGYDFLCDGGRLVRHILDNDEGRYEELLCQNNQRPNGDELNKTDKK